MKKAFLILLAFAMVGVAFADELKSDPKLVDLSANAAILFGADLDTGSTAFSNTANIELNINIISEGSASTKAGEGVWGELVIKADDGNFRIHLDADPTEAAVNPALDPSIELIIDVAKIHFPNGYIGIKKDATKIDYVDLADMAAPYFKVDNTKYYGQMGTTLLSDTDPNVGPNAKYGFVFDYAFPKLVEFKVDLRSFNKLDTSGTGNTHIAKGDLDENTKNAFGLRAKAILLAVDNLTLEGAMNTAFGGKNAKYDMGFGGKLGYKYMLDDKMYVKPNAGINFVMDNAAASGVAKGTEDLSYVAKAGVLLGWGEKSEAIDTYFFDDSDQDWGYYPGLSAGMSLKSKKFNGGTNPDAMMGMNVSFLSGDLVPNLTAAVAFEVADVQAKKLEMGFSAVAKYAVAMDPMTVTPKVGINYYSNEANLTDEAKTDIYLKAGLEVSKIIPNCTLSFEYASNDLNGGVGNMVKDADTLGLFYTKFKIAF